MINYIYALIRKIHPVASPCLAIQLPFLGLKFTAQTMLGCKERNPTYALRMPLGISIVGGLMVSQLLTLYITPVVYLYLDRVSVWGQKLINN